ncbi:uncharacterized protein N0V89_007554 [Didymosphaeria variabile]|uniref:Protein kinase domain-containing protein n=1 Tax=Didymosphaeria variabile TaxID=1932322 RepID=A0A9W8XJR1_9PLEO|nr:uncharacterized protein N0V89_007554 [Didymosphaeria variabile]KAJ4352207.1 hypothetical protein N0V89_007554 [Didymosphaeria variabile]
MDASREELEDAIAHIIPDKPFPKYIDETVFLELQSLLSQHPDKIFSVWAHENPRLFLLLRMLGCDDDALYQKLDSEKISDFWLPLGSATLNQLSSYTDIAAQDWRRAQLHVLSQSDQMSEQKLTSPIHAHRHIQNGNAHFEELDKLGKGGSAEVARVRHKLSAKEFACKRIKRAPEVKLQRNQLIEFNAEVSVLKRVSHHHLVSFVASFTDLSSFSLILNPVAKDVLKSMLERQARDEPLPEADISALRRSLGCLATALAYLHEEGVRHKDIKPGNILLSDGCVYLCDFGISRDWSKAEHSTTEDEVLKLTPRYCAPEVFEKGPRNTKSDVWSLGCVFLEIISVVKGYPMEEFNSFLLDASDHQSEKGLWCALDAMTAWLEEIRSEKNDSADDVPLGWIMTMIRPEKEHRIKASELVEMIVKCSSELEGPDLYIGPCCTRPDSVALPDSVDSPTLNAPSFQGLERHILNTTYASTPDNIPFDSSVPTIQTCAKCEVGEDRIQIYETYRTRPENSSTSTMPMLWWSTRRLVISYVSGQPKMRHCSSFWLPLADIQCKLAENTVTLKWSDCNQMTERMSGNYSTHYDWIYNPSSTNNSIQVRFNTSEDARRFVDIVRLPYEDGETISNGRQIDVSENTELNIFDVGRPGVRNYRAATLTFVNNSLATSKLYIQWPEADLDIHIRDSFDARSAASTGYEMVVEVKNVATPTYHSDTRGEPAADYDRVARFNEARQLKTSLAVAFQIGLKHGLPRPPDGVTDMLQGLTGWTLCYFAIVTRFKSKNKRFGSKRHGRADVMLWEKEVDDTTAGFKRRGAKVVFRLHEAELLWASGSITGSTSISTSAGQDATISVSKKTRGKLLNVSKMVAIASEATRPSDSGHSRGHSDVHEDMSDLVLTFENEQYRLEFVKLVTHFKTAAATAAPLSRTATGVESMRRMNSPASTDVHISPPMR